MKLNHWLVILACLLLPGCGDFEWFPDTRRPDPFTFATINDVDVNTVVAAAAVTISGANPAMTISVANGEYAIDNGAFTNQSGVIHPGQKVAVRHTSAGDFLTATVTTLTIQFVSATFTSVTKASPNPKPGDVVKTIPYPPGIAFIGDVVFDKTTSSLWALTGTSTAITGIVQIDIQSGAVKRTIPKGIGVQITTSSQLAFDGQNFWATSNISPIGLPSAFIYKLDANGILLASFATPPANTGGLNQGLTWDGSSLWSGASNSTGLTQFNTNGNVLSTLPNLWQTVGIVDVSFDTKNNQLLVFRNNGLTIVDPLTRIATLAQLTIANTVGDWDGSVFWAANNTKLRIEGINLGID